MSGAADSLRDRIAAALHAHGTTHLPDDVPADEYDCCADVVMGVLSEQPWTGWRYVGAEPSSSPSETPDSALPHIGTFHGPCGLCGGPDARHRVVDAAVDLVSVDGEDEADVQWDWPPGTARRLAAGWRPDDWQGELA